MFTARDAASLMLAQSLLEDAGISCVVNGDFAQDIVSWGRIGTGWSIATGPPTVLVKSENAEVAREALAGLEDYRPSRVPLGLRILAVSVLVLSVAISIVVFLRAR